MQVVVFNGIKYYKHPNGYYECSSTSKRIREKTERRLHRAVWKFYNGDIPKGYHIHHIDENKDNNDISNLELVSASQHSKKHSNRTLVWWKTKEGKTANKKGIENAKQWHASEKGKLWHSIHQKEYLNKIRIVETCQECCKPFGTFNDKRHQVYCRKCRDKFLHRKIYKNKKLLSCTI